jgi:flavin reductase (DIM6/NTAB) family NADH-FMN oxidoreductase RutF
MATGQIFDKIVATADTPIYLVTVDDGSRRAGCLVGFATQVSIEPRRFLICVSKANHTYQVAGTAKYLAVHLIDRENLALAQLFGAETGDDVDKFSWCRWQDGPHGLPILDEAVAWFAGPILDRPDFGDHIGLVVAPDSGHAPEDAIAIAHYSDVADIEPGHPA